MVEKIYVRPEEVRGLGNIVIPKSLEDYDTYKSVLTEGSDEVYGTVYTMSQNSFDGITLTSDKDILSYNGGTNPDVATLTAQLTYDGQAVSVKDQLVVLEVRKQSDDSLVQRYMQYTDVNGRITVSYTSKGAGDIYIKAECSLLIQTYDVEDCGKYDGTEHTETFSSSLANPILYDVGTSDCIVELDVQTSGYYYLVGLGYFSGSTLTEHISYGASSANTGARWISATKYDDVPYNSSYYTLKWVRTSNNMKLYLNGTLITDTTQSMVTTLNKLLISSWNAKTVKYKNLKVKPL